MREPGAFWGEVWGFLVWSACVVVVFWLLAGCASSDVELSPRVERAYAEFLAHPQGMAFAVSEDGREYGYSICEYDICWGNGARVAIDVCEERGAGCVIFD